MLTGTQLDKAIADRAQIRITEGSGYHKGVIGIAMGFRPAYGNVKVGFIDEDGLYTGDYTVVSYEHVELIERETPMLTTERIEQELMDAGFVPALQTDYMVAGGFVVAEEGDRVVVTYLSSRYGSLEAPIGGQRSHVAYVMCQMERALSKLGHSVIMFEPEEGTEYRLTLR